MRTMAAMKTTTAMTPRGWRPVLTGFLRVRLGPTSTPLGREPPKEATRVPTLLPRRYSPRACTKLGCPAPPTSPCVKGGRPG